MAKSKQTNATGVARKRTAKKNGGAKSAANRPQRGTKGLLPVATAATPEPLAANAQSHRRPEHAGPFPGVAQEGGGDQQRHAVNANAPNDNAAAHPHPPGGAPPSPRRGGEHPTPSPSLAENGPAMAPRLAAARLHTPGGAPSVPWRDGEHPTPSPSLAGDGPAMAPRLATAHLHTPGGAPSPPPLPLAKDGPAMTPRSPAANAQSRGDFAVSQAEDPCIAWGHNQLVEWLALDSLRLSAMIQDAERRQWYEREIERIVAHYALDTGHEIIRHTSRYQGLAAALFAQANRGRDSDGNLTPAEATEAELHAELERTSANAAAAAAAAAADAAGAGAAAAAAANAAAGAAAADAACAAAAAAGAADAAAAAAGAAAAATAATAADTAAAAAAAAATAAATAAAIADAADAACATCAATVADAAARGGFAGLSPPPQAFGSAADAYADAPARGGFAGPPQTQQSGSAGGNRWLHTVLR